MLRTMQAGVITLAALLIVAGIPARASAHETRTVANGRYEMVVGFFVEPAFEGQKNGVAVRVRTPGTPPSPVTGVEQTLQVEVTHLASNRSVTLPLRTIFNDPGHYTADLMPTQPGQYRFRFFGRIQDTEVNETFTSGERFNNIDPIQEIQFPDKVSQVRSVEGAALDAQAAADDAAAAASTARLIAVVALIAALGALATTLGLMFRPGRA